MKTKQETLQVIGHKRIRCPHKGCTGHVSHSCEICNDTRFVSVPEDIANNRKESEKYIKRLLQAETFYIVQQIIHEETGIENVSSDTCLYAELGIEYIEFGNLIRTIEQRFDVELTAGNISTVQDIVNLLESKGC